LEEFQLYKEPRRLREMFLNQYLAMLMGPLHLPPLMLHRRRSPIPYIISKYNNPRIINLHTITSLCISHNLPHFPMSWSMNIITGIIIQDLCMNTNHVHPDFITPLLWPQRQE
jgi:hypothetical protein